MCGTVILLTGYYVRYYLTLTKYNRRIRRQWAVRECYLCGRCMNVCPKACALKFQRRVEHKQG